MERFENVLRSEWNVKQDTHRSFTAHNGNYFLSVHEPEQNSGEYRVELGSMEPLETLRIEEGLSIVEARDYIGDWSYEYREGEKYVHTEDHD